MVYEMVFLFPKIFLTLLGPSEQNTEWIAKHLTVYLNQLSLPSPNTYESWIAALLAAGRKEAGWPKEDSQ